MQLRDQPLLGIEAVDSPAGVDVGGRGSVYAVAELGYSGLVRGDSVGDLFGDNGLFIFGLL